MAESVTRHALIPLEQGYQFLLAGIDSLDLGVYVAWDASWPLTLTHLQSLKEQGQGKNGQPDQSPHGRTFLHLPSGKPPNYRYHLQFAEYHLFLAMTNPPGKSPNAYLSFNAKALWQLGVYRSIELVHRDLKELGGRVEKIQPSRVDLAADFHVPGGFTLDFLIRHKVSRSRAVSHHAMGDKLETFYVGAPGAALLLRIYDKGKEITKAGKEWFLDLWGRDGPQDVWRVEFQLRREVLKDHEIDNLDDLMAKLGGLWRYLTNEWFSLRHLDKEKQERRTLFPWWRAVQDINRFGVADLLLPRQGSDVLQSVEWYVSHIAGCLPSYAARIGEGSFHEALNHLSNQICRYWFGRDYSGEYAKRTLKLGNNINLKEIKNDYQEEMCLFKK
jgi:hypothetical protein